MASFANVTLNTKVYNPSTIEKGMTKWLERSGGVPNSFGVLALSVTPPSSGAKNYRAYTRMVTPVVKGEDSSCGCAGDFLRQIGFEVNATFAPGSTLAERTDAYLRFAAWVSHANFIAAFQNLEATYG
jgi:hypothetical protein